MKRSGGKLWTAESASKTHTAMISESQAAFGASIPGRRERLSRTWEPQCLMREHPSVQDWLNPAEGMLPAADDPGRSERERWRTDLHDQVEVKCLVFILEMLFGPCGEEEHFETWEMSKPRRRGSAFTEPAESGTSGRVAGGRLCIPRNA